MSKVTPTETTEAKQTEVATYAEDLAAAKVVSILDGNGKPVSLLDPKPEVGTLFDMNASGMELFESMMQAGFVRFAGGRAVISVAKTASDGGYTIATVAAVNFAGMGERAIKKLEAGLDPAREQKAILRKMLEKTPGLTEEGLLEIMRQVQATLTPNSEPGN